MKSLNMSVLWLSIGLVLVGCSEESASKAVAGGIPPAQVEVVTPQTIQQQETLVLPERLQAVRSAEVRARVEGIVERRLL